VGITLNTVFVVVEAVYGVIAGSMAWSRMPGTTSPTCSDW
jgi:hypothetical protein